MKKSLITLILVLSLITVFAQPSGTIVAFGGPKTKVPAGWVLCDGTLYDQTNATYNNLFKAIGVSWGGDGVNKFAVPDLRGIFLRGVSDETNMDPEKNIREKSRTDLNSSGNGGNTVGSKQTDELKSHTHSASINGGNFPVQSSGMGIQSNEGIQVSFGALSVAINSTGGTETRPKNAYVFYIIKL